MRAMSLRLPERQEKALKALAKVEGTSASEVARAAIADRIDERLRRAVERSQEANREMLELLRR